MSTRSQGSSNEADREGSGPDAIHIECDVSRVAENLRVDAEEGDKGDFGEMCLYHHPLPLECWGLLHTAPVIRNKGPPRSRMFLAP